MLSFLWSGAWRIPVKISPEALAVSGLSHGHTLIALSLLWCLSLAVKVLSGYTCNSMSGQRCMCGDSQSSFFVVPSHRPYVCSWNRNRLTSACSRPTKGPSEYKQWKIAGTVGRAIQQNPNCGDSRSTRPIIVCCIAQSSFKTQSILKFYCECLAHEYSWILSLYNKLNVVAYVNTGTPHKCKKRFLFVYCLLGLCIGNKVTIWYISYRGLCIGIRITIWVCTKFHLSRI